MSRELYLEETGDWFHKGKLSEFEQKFKNIEKVDCFDKNSVYSLKLFTEHLTFVQTVFHPDDITSCVARCVEYGFKAQLELLLDKINYLIGLTAQKLDKRLLLRRAVLT